MKKPPTSPHLQIYRWQWTMFFSILHRMTGVVITAGMAFLCLKLTIFAFYPPAFDVFIDIGNTLIFILIKSCFAWSLLYHMFQGIRHLIFDAAKLLDLRYARLSGYIAFSAATLIWLLSLEKLTNYNLF